MSYVWYFFILLLITAYMLYKYIYDYDYWKRKGVYFIKPLPFIGNLYDAFTFRYSFGHVLGKFYLQVDEPYFGIYLLNKPCFIPKCPNLIQSILVKDFRYFCDRGLLCDEKCDPILSKTLGTVKGPIWKQLRSNVSPFFTLGKLKNMYYLINEVAQAQNMYIEKNINNGIAVKEMSAKYITDTMMSCFFGINAYSLSDENAEVRTVCKRMFGFSYKMAFHQSCYFMAHAIVKVFQFPFIEAKVGEFFQTVFLKTIREREFSKHIRHDLIDVIIESKKQGKSDESSDVAQAIQFIVAGLETTSSSIAFILYELAMHSEVQNKLRQEIDSVISEHGEFTYDAIQDMNYLNMVISEGLRKHPALAFFDRICTEDYKIPGSELVLEKGTTITIPLLGMHLDEKYFPEPNKFDPERFFDRSLISKFSYMPFGEGPRSCIGERFALFASKLGIAQILSAYELEPCEATPVHIEYDSRCFFLGPVGGIPLKFKKLASDAN